MEWKETEQTTEIVLERMEKSLESLEQMSFDSINITDKLVMRIDELRCCADEMKASEGQKNGQYMLDVISRLLQELLTVAFEVNNVSHNLEQETAYQRETVNNIKQIISLLYSMSGV